MAKLRATIAALVVFCGSFLALADAASAQMTIDKSAGFGTTTDMTANPAAAFVGTRARLTPATNGQAGSVFFTNQVDVTTFTSTFTFQITPGTGGMADGMSFIIQGGAATALGAGGGGLGFQNMPTSVGIKLDIYDNSGEGTSSTGIYLNGANPTNVGSVNLLPGINLQDANVKRVDMTYDGTTLTVTITDTVNSNTNTQNYTVNIPGTVGGNMGRVGFAAGTGGLHAVHEVITWTYANPPPAPTGLTATPGLLENVLNWNPVTGATSYNVKVSNTPGGPYTQLANVTGTTYTHTGLDPNLTYYYVVTAVGPNGESGNSTEAAAQPTAPPRTNDHEEGLFDGKCACNAIGVNSAPWPLAFLGLVLLVRRRK